MAKILDGKIVSERIRNKLKEEVIEFKKYNRVPGLAVIIIGEDKASKIYVKKKQEACKEIGIYSEKYELPENTTQDELLLLIKKLNNNEKINGILVQLPLPKHIDEKKVIDEIDPRKDVDAFTCENVGKIALNCYDFLPCTPAGILEILKYYKIEVEGKECVIVGRSNIVGKPTAFLLLNNNATVTICHSKTNNLSKICKRADILISAVGKAKFINKSMVKENVVIIDAGINRAENGKIFGDVDFDDVKEKASYITPVPGGVGPMTITMLLNNTIKSFKKGI